MTQNKKLASIISDSSYLPAKAPKTKSLSKGIESVLFDLLDNPVMTELEKPAEKLLPIFYDRIPPEILIIEPSISRALKQVQKGKVVCVLSRAGKACGDH